MKQYMKYSTLPLFLIWRENFDEFDCFHMTTCPGFFFFGTLRGSKDVIFYGYKKIKTQSSS